MCHQSCFRVPMGSGRMECPAEGASSQAPSPAPSGLPRPLLPQALQASPRATLDSASREPGLRHGAYLGMSYGRFFGKNRTEGIKVASVCPAGRGARLAECAGLLLCSALPVGSKRPLGRADDTAPCSPGPLLCPCFHSPWVGGQRQDPWRLMGTDLQVPTPHSPLG